MSSPQPQLVITPIGDRPLRVFRATIPLPLTANGAVDAVEFDVAQTALQGVFEPYTFNALAANAPVVAQRSPLGTAVLITLDQPLPIKTIRLSSSTPLAPQYTLAFHRVDGIMVETPTVTASIFNRLATPTAEFIDGRFAVQLRDATGNPVPLAITNLVEITLQSYPTTPRLGLLDERVTPAALLPIWQAPGEIGRVTPSNQGIMNAGAALATTLQRYLKAHPEALTMPLKLMAESDAPCQLRLNRLTLTPQFVLQRFPRSDSSQSLTKQVLRFSGKSAATQTLHIPLPAHHHITAATLEIAESLRPQTVTALEGDVNGSPNLPILTTPTGHEGICVQLERTLAQRLTIPLATRVKGIALAMMAIAPNTILHLAVHEDNEGRPAGKPVAESDLPATSVGEPIWAIASFANPVVLFAQPYWLVLSATQGQALWLSQPGSGTVQIVDHPMQLQQEPAAHALTALTGLYHWLISDAIAPPSPSEQSASAPQSSLEVRIGGQPVQAALINGKQRYDLTAVLNQHPTSSSETLIPVEFSTTSTGSITVYPPRILFTGVS